MGRRNCRFQQFTTASHSHIEALENTGPELKMRAEIQSIVDEIKQSVGLLRRHL